jgi:MFS family permease
MCSFLGKVFTALGFVSAIGTGLVPLAVLHGGFYYFLFCRVLQGIAFAGNMPVFGSFLAHWVYFKQMATFTAVLCTYVQLAPAFTMPVAGFLCESRWGWPAVYYVHCK